MSLSDVGFAVVLVGLFSLHSFFLWVANATRILSTLKRNLPRIDLNCRYKFLPFGQSLYLPALAHITAAWQPSLRQSRLYLRSALLSPSDNCRRHCRKKQKHEGFADRRAWSRWCIWTIYETISSVRDLRRA